MDHPLMGPAEWQAIYDRAWGLYYSPAHVETLLKRAVASRISAARLANMIFYFYASHTYERVHPLQSGVLRRKLRRQRRPGLAVESPFVFYPRRVRDLVLTYGSGLAFLWQLTRLRWRIQRDPANEQYTDRAIAPADDDGLEMYQATEGARIALAQARQRAATIRAAREGGLAVPRPHAGDGVAIPR
jgi:hypothetical protein